MLSLVCRFLLGWFLGFTLLCGAVCIAGAVTYLDDPAWEDFGFTTCALPCWAGITPGQTSFEKAYALLDEYIPALHTSLLTEDTDITMTASSPQQLASGVLYNRDGLVDSIRLNVQMPLGQLLLSLGAPDCFIYTPSSTSRSGGITVYWVRDEGLIAALMLPSEQPIQPNSSIQVIALNIGLHNCDRETMFPWRGFSPRWHFALQNRLD